MKRLALFLVLIAATTAHAQKVFRCVDAQGKAYYTEKFAPGCKSTGIDAAPAAAAAAKEAAAKEAAAKAAAIANPPPSKPPNVKYSGAMPLTPKAHCDGLRAEAARLASGKPEVANMYLPGIQKELARSCP
jgi:hypothetical protein